MTSHLPPETLERFESVRTKLGKLEEELAAILSDVKVVLAPPIPRVATKLPSNQFDPYLAGRRAVEGMKEAEDGAWTGPELESRFALSSATLHRRRKEHRIVYWRDAQHEFHYPKWQFTESGALLPGVQEILQTFRSQDEWRILRYFLGARKQLSGRRPLDWLREGKKEEALKHASLHAQENTW